MDVRLTARRLQVALGVVQAFHMLWRFSLLGLLTLALLVEAGGVLMAATPAVPSCDMEAFPGEEGAGDEGPEPRDFLNEGEAGWRSVGPRATGFFRRSEAVLAGVDLLSMHCRRLI